jgi:predicted GNAT family acetyltransferase
MAGERLRVPGAIEISAVCTDPAYQRRGLAAALVARLVGDIVARGERPFLHVADDNHGARRVYEALGFTVRARVDALILRTPA